MTDDPSSPYSNTSISGGVNLDADRIDIGGDVVGRDKIVSTSYGFTAEQVSVLLTQISTTFQPRPFDGRCPYLGLATYDEDSADLFFGREALIAELVARAKEARWVFITGPSGSGKSSLARAGLLHALKDGALPGSDRWLYETLKPGRNPLDELARLASSLAGSLSAGEDVRTKGLTDPTVFHQWVEIALKDDRQRRAVILVDQFEETFTQVAREAERAAFLNLLTHAATLAGGRVILVLAMRSDFVSNCAAYPQLNDLLNQQFLQVGAMLPAELVSAIAQPALRVDLQVEPALVAQIIADMKGEPGALPLVQFALRDLFDAQQAQGGVIALTLKDYRGRGGIHKALERHADHSFAALSNDEQQIARDVFSGLIQVGRGAEDTRRTALLDELVPAGVEAARVESVVGKLADARLIITDEREGRDIVTISHEKLIEAWPWLRRLVNANRDAIALQNQIAEDAAEWEQHQHDASYLYGGARLANAREQLTTRKIVLGGLAQTFVTASVEAEETDRAREATRVQKELDDARRLAESEKQRAEEQTRSAARFKRALAVVALLAIAALALGALAGTFGVKSNQAANTNATLAAQNQSIASAAQTAEAKAVAEAAIRATAEIRANLQRDEAQQQSRIARSRQLLVNSDSNESNQTDLAILLSIEANRVADTPETRSNLLAGLEQHRGLITILRKHAASVLSVAFSPNGSTLASSGCISDTGFCSLGEIRLWDVSDPKNPIQVGKPLRSHNNRVRSVAFSPDGQTLASGDWSGVIILWDVSDPKNPIQLGEPLRGHTGAVYSVAFSPNGKLLASSGCSSSFVESTGECTPGELILWDVSNPKNPVQLGAPLNGHRTKVRGVAFSPDSRTLASGSEDKTIILWDVSNPENPVQLGGPLEGHKGWIYSVAFSPDGHTLASGGCGADRISTGVCGPGEVILWDVSNRQAPVPIGAPHKAHSDGVYSVAFSPDGRTLASGSGDDTIILWDVSDLKQPIQSGAPLRGHTGGIPSVAFSPNGQMLASGSEDKTINLWDVSNLRSPIQIGAPLRGHAGTAQDLVYSLNGQILASAGDDNTIILWDMSNPKHPVQLSVTRSHTGRLHSVAFSPNGKLLASGGCNGSYLESTGNCTPGEVILWDVSQPKNPVQLGTPLIGHIGEVYSVAFSPNGQTLASASEDETIVLWDVSNPKNPVQLDKALSGHTGGVYSVAFSPNGQILAAASEDKTIILWDVSDLKNPVQAGTLFSRSPYVLSNIVFSPHGQTLASGGGPNGTLTLWDVSNPKEPVQLNDPLNSDTGNQVKVAFSPDGQLLASSDFDGLLLWGVSNPKNRVQLGMRLQGHTEWMRNIAFSPVGKVLASSGCGAASTNLNCTQGEIILWDVNPVSWQALACQMAGRNFTRAEWQQYLGEEPYRKTCEQWPLESELTSTPALTPTP